MKEGSLVVSISNFADVKKDWPGIRYPKKGQVLTVEYISSYRYKTKWKLLTFVEFKTVPLCSKNFREVEHAPIEEIELELIDTIKQVV